MSRVLPLLQIMALMVMSINLLGCVSHEPAPADLNSSTVTIVDPPCDGVWNVKSRAEFRTRVCYPFMKDAGKACTDGSQCDSGSCRVVGDFVKLGMVTQGMCPEVVMPYGCRQEVKKGKATAALCID